MRVHAVVSEIKRKVGAQESIMFNVLHVCASWRDAQGLIDAYEQNRERSAALRALKLTEQVYHLELSAWKP